ncbi:hypothetical protein [Paracoccus sp. (in: a-proteobacteria)]|jgi:hypothetical protein|uniref:hypothetical protein n=1 Tax=Paracoccus sp. TaxID=267 RepID=UPI00321FC5F2
MTILPLELPDKLLKRLAEFATQRHGGDLSSAACTLLEAWLDLDAQARAASPLLGEAHAGAEEGAPT